MAGAAESGSGTDGVATVSMVRPGVTGLPSGPAMMERASTTPGLIRLLSAAASASTGVPGATAMVALPWQPVSGLGEARPAQLAPSPLAPRNLTLRVVGVEALTAPLRI